MVHLTKAEANSPFITYMILLLTHSDVGHVARVVVLNKEVVGKRLGKLENACVSGIYFNTVPCKN